MLASFATLGIQVTSESTNRTLQERTTLARVIAARVDDRLNESIGIVQVMIAMDELDPASSDTAAQRRTVQAIRSHLADFAYYVALLDSQRRLVAVDPEVDDIPQFDCSDAECIRQVQMTGKPVISRAFEFSTPAPTVAMVVPIFARDGRVSGVVFVALNLNAPRFTELLQPPELGQTGYAAIVDDSGVILGSTRAELRWKVDDHRGHFYRLIQDKKTNVGTCHSCHTDSPNIVSRREEVMAFAPLSASRWGVALRQERDEVFTYSDSMQGRVLLLGNLAFVIAAASTWFLTRKFVQPLGALTRACQEIAKGNLSTPLPHISEGELGQLTGSFEFMRQQLIALRTRTEGWTAELEERIRQRTSELQESHAQLLRANRDLATLNALGDLLRESMDLNTTLDSALHQLMQLENACAASICLSSDTSTKLGMPLHHAINCTGDCVCEWPTAQSVVRRALDQKHAAACAVPLAVMPSGEMATQDGARTFPVAYVPLIGKGRTVGIMCLIERDGSLSDADLELLTSIGVQVGIAVENGLLFNALREKEEARSKLLRKVIAAQEEERQRIARELHDESSQTLTVLRVGLETAIMAPATTAEDVKARLAPMKDVATGMLTEIQRMIHDLRPSLLDDLGLIQAITWLAETRLKVVGVQASLEVNGIERRLATEVEMTVFRLAQEAINNVAKHAGAENVNILLDYGERFVALEVEDDGRGFDIDVAISAGNSTRTYGLLGMRERIDLLGGTLAIESRIGQGTRIRVEIPVQAEEVNAYGQAQDPDPVG